jgi:aminopeptidase
MDEQEFFEKFAELAIRIGVNLQPDQDLVVFADVEHAPLVRATMEATAPPPRPGRTSA